MAKKLTATDLNKLSKGINETRTYPILDGQFDVIINQHFKDTSINNIFTGLVEVVKGIEASELTELTFSRIAQQIGMTLMLREFTDLPIPNKNDFQTLIKVYENLLNTNIYVEVMNKLPEDQIRKVEKRFNDIKSTFDEIERKANETTTVPVEAEHNGDSE
ncbi:hypothetical protein G7L40_00475 [Paenibacillus polymyxa]|uniref:Uncharacterized protein n=1 Tax=Paenibacillus polymyxa TaxID=1406 RepID=A0A378XXD9_PAEPO|nr:hypothetical protein [Paenibacillus polymyxa]MBE7897185.1 hypothetical protein [Paenibacillus polymyxa]MBG9763041.1 hypothetical protein [Paenibacillus polymyxa]MCC3257565.1 hypothetical protein [Paenibacillus polymyxa]QPK51350.1 hypothetical protein G7035_00475 [Paenibacillus polymyxa]QPK56440.1 hypothetical protein G7L40_00475 [Paenibacillus polymyxa]